MSVILPCHIVIVPAEFQSRCNAIAYEIGIDPANAGTLIIPLVPIAGEDDAEATHWGVCGCMLDAHRVALLTALAQPENADIASAAHWVRMTNHGPERGVVQASCDGLRVGEVWSWEQSLTELELKLQILPDEL